MKLDSALLRFLRVSKVLGVFPVQTLEDGSLQFSPYSPLTFLAIALPLAYTGAILCSFVFDVLLETHRLSYLLSIVPNALLTVISDLVIRISSVLYTNELIQLVSIISDRRYGPAGGFVEQFSWVVSTLFLTCFALYNGATVGGDMYVEAGTGVVMASIWVTSSFLHDAAQICALGFILIFGKQVLSHYEGLCGEMLKLCKNNKPSLLFTAVANVESVEKVPGAGNVSSWFDPMEQLVHRFEKLQVAFGIFSSIGGTFVLALVLDVATWLYCLACNVLFNQYTSPSAFVLSLTVLGALLDILVLVAIAELGQQMKNKVVWTN